MQQQIWGEVVDFNLAFFQFIWECNSENIIKIDTYLPKLLQEKFGAVFLAHPVYLQYIYGLHCVSESNVTLLSLLKCGVAWPEVPRC